MLKGILVMGLAAAALYPLGTHGQEAWGPAGRPYEDTRVKEDRLQAQILERIAEGALSNRNGRRLLRDLDEIRRIDAFYRSPLGQGTDGAMTEAQRRDILSRLDRLRGGLTAELAQRLSTRSR
jgi:hypothetical protein